MTERTMRAVASYRGLPAEDPGILVDVEVPVPDPGPRDVLVRVRAVSVNPVDVKVRAGLEASDGPRILGFDAAGVVEAAGGEVTTLQVGDDVWYAGDLTRAGSNAEFQVVDERLVARKPRGLGFAEAAALPLTGITAWETLFDRFALDARSTGTLLALGGAGGVGSILIQLAKQLTGLRVLASAGRPETAQWVTGLGADAVVDHHDLAATATAAAPEGIDYLLSPHSAGNVDTYARIMRPGGHITAIDEPEGLDLLPLKAKSIAWHWEFMFTRPMFRTSDMIEHKNLLQKIAALVDDGRIRSTVTTTIEDFSAAGLRRAHQMVESGRSIGKVVVAR